MTAWHHDIMTSWHYDIMTLWHHDMKTWQHDKQSLLSIYMKTKVVQHVLRINIKHLTCDIWQHGIMTWRHDRMTNNHFWAYTWKQKLFSMSQGSTLSIWHMTSWLQDMTKKSIFRLNMKTKVVHYVPRINQH